MRGVVNGLWSEKLLHVAETITLKEKAINKGVIKPGTHFGLKTIISTLLHTLLFARLICVKIIIRKVWR